MSTVAWDGRELAVDSQRTIGSARVRGVKLYESAHLAFAGVGSTADSVHIAKDLVRWDPGMVLTREGVEGWVFEHLAEEDILHGIAVEKRSGRAFLVLGKRVVHLPIPPDTPATAGSGAEYAMGAMARGASASEAVQLAIEHDCFSGFEVRSVVVEGEAQAGWREMEAESSARAKRYRSDLETAQAALLELRGVKAALDCQVKVNQELVEEKREMMALLPKCKTKWCKEKATHESGRCTGCEIPF